MSDNTPLVIDLTSIPDEPTVDNGTYDVKISWAKKRVSEAGNDMLSVRYTIIEPGGVEPEIERTIMDSFVFMKGDMTNFAWRRIKAFAQAVYGPNPGAPVSFEPEVLLGERLTVTVLKEIDKRSTDTIPGIDPATNEARPMRLNVKAYKAYDPNRTVDALINGL